METRIRDVAKEAGERLQEIILELEADRTMPLHRSIRAALYDAGTALAKLSTTILLVNQGRG